MEIDEGGRREKNKQNNGKQMNHETITTRNKMNNITTNELQTTLYTEWSVWSVILTQYKYE